MHIRNGALRRWPLRGKTFSRSSVKLNGSGSGKGDGITSKLNLYAHFVCACKGKEDRYLVGRR